jgi:hypothetical protein
MCIKPEENIVELAKKVDFDEMNVDDVEEILNSRKEELSIEDLAEVEEGHYHIKMLMREHRSLKVCLCSRERDRRRHFARSRNVLLS